MIKVSLTFTLVEEMFKEGNELNYKVKEGIPPNFHLVEARPDYMRKEIELFFDANEIEHKTIVVEASK